MLYNQKKLDALIDRWGMRHEVGRLFEAGVTYEVLAETLSEFFKSVVETRSKLGLRHGNTERNQDIVCKHYGIGTEKDYSNQELGREYKISREMVRIIIERNSLDALPSYIGANQKSPIKAARARKEIYERALDKFLQRTEKTDDLD